jgi:hypothetical protein
MQGNTRPHRCILTRPQSLQAATVRVGCSAISRCTLDVLLTRLDAAVLLASLLGQGAEFFKELVQVR